MLLPAKALKKEINIEVNKNNVINCMKSIKRVYRDIEQMLSQSGFIFNSTTKKVECTDEVWETYVKVTHILYILVMFIY